MTLFETLRKSVCEEVEPTEPAGQDAPEAGEGPGWGWQFEDEDLKEKDDSEGAYIFPPKVYPPIVDAWKRREQAFADGYPKIDQGRALEAKAGRLNAKARKVLRVGGDGAIGESEKLKGEANTASEEGDRVLREGLRLTSEGSDRYQRAVTKMYGKKTNINWRDGRVKVYEG